MFAEGNLKAAWPKRSMSFPQHPGRTPDGLSSSPSRKGGNPNTGRTRGFHSLPPKYRHVLLLARGHQPTGELAKSIAPVFVFMLLFAPRCGNEQARHLPSACFSSSSQLAGALIAHTDTHTHGNEKWRRWVVHGACNASSVLGAWTNTAAKRSCPIPCPPAFSDVTRGMKQ